MSDFPRFIQKLKDTFALKSEVSSSQSDWNETDGSKLSFIKNKPGVFKSCGPRETSVSAYSEAVIGNVSLEKGTWELFGSCFTDGVEGYKMMNISTDTSYKSYTPGIGNSKIPYTYIHSFRILELSSTTNVYLVARCEVDSYLSNCYLQAVKVK